MAVCCLPGVHPAGATTQTWTDTSWASTVFYRGDFQAPDVATGSITITAVDRYQLSLNGTAVGADSSWTAAETYPIAVKKGANQVLVRVDNLGQGHGSGLVVQFQVPSVNLSSSIVGGGVVWRWTVGDPAAVTWASQPFAQIGSLEARAVSGLSDSVVTVIAGFPGDVDPGQAGGLAISRVEGANLALNQPASRIEVTDGLPQTAWQAGVNALNKFVSIDLGQKRTVDRVRVVTAPPGAGATYAASSLKGYSVQISDDQFRWSEVGVLHGITTYESSQVDFPPVSTRYLRVVVAEIDGVNSPQVGEIQAYGAGYHAEGIFQSAALSLGAPSSPKNFGRARWTSQAPAGTSVHLQFRTSQDGQTWSAWSGELADSGSYFVVREPAVFLQYQVLLRTQRGEDSPRLSRVALDFSTDELPAASATASITPQRVPMGVDTTFVYHVDLSGGQGVARLDLGTPGDAVLQGVDGYAGQVASRTSADGLILSFDPPARGSMDVRFTAALFAPTFLLRSALFAPGSDNPLFVAAATDGALSVLVSDVVRGVLLDVGARPRVFTPNGDNANDFTVIELTLVKVTDPADVVVRVLDLSGRVVKTLSDGPLLPRRYARGTRSAEEAQDLPGYWDGTDSGGGRVPPGLYLYSVEAHAGDQTPKLVGTIGVVY